MNAHDRRKESRRRHMGMPLGKQVRVADLLNRKVYSYRLGESFVLDDFEIESIVNAKVNRHVRPGHGGLIDILLTSRHGHESVISTSAKGIRLAKPQDRALRPWWVETRRKHAASAKARSAP
jgi:hypothetical protein